jgi:two-component system phosphate regulon sensor histidine kinase PhoR
MAIQLQSQIGALETERSKLAAVLQGMTDGVLIVDQDGLVQLMNPAAENMFGIRQDKALGRSLAEVVRYYQLVELWERSRERMEPQVTSLDMGANRLYLQGVATPLEEALPGSTLFILQNLTRVRQLETVRRDFISNISHELRTPLASLKALSETLTEGALEDPPAARRFLQRMEAEVDALSQMVSELLELSRIESDGCRQDEVDARGEILTSAINRLQVQAERGRYHPIGMLP